MATIPELQSEDQFDQLRATPDTLLIFVFIKKGVSLCDQAKPIALELWKTRPKAVMYLVDSLAHPILSTKCDLKIWPTWRTYFNGELLNNYQGGVKVGVMGNFERFFKNFDNPYVPPPAQGPVKTTNTFQGAELRPSRGPGIAKTESAPLPGQNVAATSPRGPQQPLAATNPSAIAQRLQTMDINPGGAPRPSQQNTDKKGADLSSLMNYGVDTNKLLGQDYQWSTEPKLVQISSAGTHMWGLDQSGMIWRWTGRKFEQVLGQLRQVSVSSDGAVWGTNFSNDIYTYSKNGWEQIQGKLKQVSVASRHIVWGITMNNEVVFYRGEHQWERIKITAQ